MSALGRKTPGYRWWLVSSIAAALGTQARYMIKNKNRWPACTFNLFNYHLPDQMPQFRVRLITAEGSVVGPTDPWGLLPLDFFRVVSIVEQIFYANSDPDVMDRWSAAVLRQLNTSPWRRRDEVRASLRPPGTEQFAALEVYLAQVHYTRCDPGDRCAVLSVELMHRHDPRGVVALVGPPEWHLVTV